MREGGGLLEVGSASPLGGELHGDIEQSIGLIVLGGEEVAGAAFEEGGGESALGQQRIGGEGLGGDVVEPVEERDGDADFIGAFGLVVGAGLEADFAVKVPGGWDACNPGDEKSRRKALLLAAAGDGVGLRAAPECGPVSTALPAGEGVGWPRRARARSGHSDAACGSSPGALRRTMSSS